MKSYRLLILPPWHSKKSENPSENLQGSPQSAYEAISLWDFYLIDNDRVSVLGVLHARRDPAVIKARSITP